VMTLTTVVAIQCAAAVCVPTHSKEKGPRDAQMGLITIVMV